MFYSLVYIKAVVRTGLLNSESVIHQHRFNIPTSRVHQSCHYTNIGLTYQSAEYINHVTTPTQVEHTSQPSTSILSLHQHRFNIPASRVHQSCHSSHKCVSCCHACEQWVGNNTGLNAQQIHHEYWKKTQNFHYTMVTYDCHHIT